MLLETSARAFSSCTQSDLISGAPASLQCGILPCVESCMVNMFLCEARVVGIVVSSWSRTLRF